MEKRYLLDSNTVIDYIGGLYPAKTEKWISQIIDDEINISIITKIEVLSFAPDNNDEYLILLDFFEVANVIELTSDIANKTIQTRQKQKIKVPDAIIASTAITNNQILISRNIKDFKHITGLEIINPYDI